MRNCSLPLIILTLAGLHLVLAQRESAQLPGLSTAGAFHMQSPPLSPGGSKPSGILLGTHWSSGDTNFGGVKPGDRTWWIAEVNGEVQVSQIPNILFPRKDGFWVAGTKEVQEGESFERYVWAAPLGEHAKSTQPNLPNSACHDETNARDILFVGSNFLAIREFGSAQCANYGEGTVYYVTTPENPNWLYKSENFGLQISDVLGPDGMDQFNKAVAAMGEAESDDIKCGRLYARPENWAILRDKGHWVVRGNGSYGGHVCDGYFGTEFDVHMRPLKDVVGYDELPIGWNRVQEAFSDAKDAFESPNGDFLLVLREGELIVCRVANGKIGAVVSRQPLHESEYAVMAQWALGDSVVRWDRQVARLLALRSK